QHAATPKLACAGLPTDRRSPSVWASVFCLLNTHYAHVALFMHRSIGHVECIGQRRSAWCKKVDSPSELIQKHQRRQQPDGVSIIGQFSEVRSQLLADRCSL